MVYPQYIYAGASGNYLYRSSDNGSSWTAITSLGVQSWRKVRCSNSGQYVLAMERNSNYWVSNDYGATWSTIAVSRDWRGCDVSGDGSTMIIGSFSGNNPRISTDYGVTWGDSNAGTNNTDVGVDGTGTNLIRANYGNYMELSTNSDASWSDATGAGSRNWRECGISDDGQSLIGVYDGGGAYYSINGGSTWTSSGLSITGAGKAHISSNGAVFIVIADGKSHISTNSGSSWTSDASSENWNDMVSSYTGAYLLGARTKSGASYPHVSEDGGSTWTALTSAGSRTWTTVAMSTEESVATGWSHNFNGVSNANIGKINGVAIASIAKVNGV